MKPNRYTLEPYKGMNTRFHCPACNSKEKTFSRYIDTLTGKYLANNVGRCSRENNCGYHYTPKQYFQDNKIEPEINICQPSVPPPRPTSFISEEVLKQSLAHYDNNNFIAYLLSLFGEQITGQLINTYKIGTSNKWSGATIFWQIDTSGKIRTGKIMLYNALTGKRVKDQYSHITWVHSLLKKENDTEYNLSQCLFGEHLLPGNTKPVAIVESEKTAIISTVYLPQFIWLASGSSNNLNPEKCKVLFNRNVTLFPDIKQFEKWNKIAEGISAITATCHVSELLEKGATEVERIQGLDLADYLVRYNYKDFMKPEKIAIPEICVQDRIHSSDEFLSKKINSSQWDDWSERIAELEQFFNSKILSSIKSLRLDACNNIIDLPKFVASHLSIVKYQNGNPRYLPYLERLECVKERILSNIQ